MYNKIFRNVALVKECSIKKEVQMQSFITLKWNMGPVRRGQNR